MMYHPVKMLITNTVSENTNTTTAMEHLENVTLHTDLFIDNDNVT